MSRRRFTLSFVALLILVGAVHARATAPAGRYTISNGTVVDTNTNLVWQQTVSAPAYLPKDAKTYCPGTSPSTSVAAGGGCRRSRPRERCSIVRASRDR